MFLLLSFHLKVFGPAWVRVASPHAHAAKQVPPNFSEGSGGTEALTYLVRVASPHAPKKLRSQNHPPHI